MLESVKRKVQGVPYLLSHPSQIKHLIIRETRYLQRNRSKQQWVEWQKYGCSQHISMMQANPAVMRASILNSTRIQIVSEMVSHLGKSLKVLDVGCGDGVIGEPIRKMGNNVISLELPTIAVLAHKCGVPLIVGGDAEHLTFASNSFDVVLASEVMEHMWDPNNFLDEAYRVLNANGYLIIETPEGIGGLNYDDHKHYFTVERLKQLLGARFAVCEVNRLKATGSAQTPTIILLLRKSSSENNRLKQKSC